MEPLVRTICCPNCSESLLSFLAAGPAECESCGWNAEVFNDRAAALERFRAYSKSSEVIVADPVPLGKTRWVVSSTRLALM